MGPHLSEVERVPLEGLRLFLGHHLDFDCRQALADTNFAADITKLASGLGSVDPGMLGRSR